MASLMEKTISMTLSINKRRRPHTVTQNRYCQCCMLFVDGMYLLILLNTYAKVFLGKMQIMLGLRPRGFEKR